MTEEFNHYTVLIYSGTDNNGQCNSSLAFHSDCTFDHDGNYLHHRNSQKENTSVVVLAVGDSRDIYFKKRVALKGDNKRYKWKLTDDKPLSFLLEDNSVFVLHPCDEIPSKKGNDDYVSQYVHGGIKVDSANTLSLALVFRVVCIDREYDPINCKLIPTVNDLKDGDGKDSDNNLSLKSALEQFKNQYLSSYSCNFHSFISNKFEEWQW